MHLVSNTAGDDGDRYEGDLGDVAAAGQARSSRVGQEFKHIACDWLESAGAQFVKGPHRVGSYRVTGVICGDNKRQFTVIAHGVVDDNPQAGARRTDTIKKAGFDAIQIQRLRPNQPVLLVTSHLPTTGAGVKQLADCAADFWDVFATTGDLEGFQRLRRYLHDTPFLGQLPAPWRQTPSVYTPDLFDAIADTVNDHNGLNAGVEEIY